MASDNSFQSQVLPGTKAVMPKEKGSDSSPRGHDGPDAGGRPRPARMRSPGCGAGQGGASCREGRWEDGDPQQE